MKWSTRASVPGRLRKQAAIPDADRPNPQVGPVGTDSRNAGARHRIANRLRSDRVELMSALEDRYRD